MRGSARIGVIGGIPIRVHWSFALLVALIALAYRSSGLHAMVLAAAWLGVLFGSVVVHELAHSMVARHRGIEVRDIVLLPIGGMSEITDVSRSASDELSIAVAGPLASLFCAGLVAVAAWVLGDRLWPPTLMAGPFSARVVWMNMVLAGFNLIPALPLDGGRILRAALWMHRGEQAATATAVSAGRAIGTAMIILGLFYDLWLALIGLFVVMGAQSEARLSTIRSALQGLSVADLMVPVHPGDIAPLPADSTTLSPNDPLYPTAFEALGRVKDTKDAGIVVVDNGVVVGLLRERDLDALVRRRTSAYRTPRR